MKPTHYLLGIFAFLLLNACGGTRQGQLPGATAAKYKVMILYANGEGKTFDMDYYEKKHMPMVAGFIGSNLVHYEIDKGISGRAATDKPTYLAIGYFYINDVDAYNKSIAQNREAVMADFKNYTNIQPVIQISEVQRVSR